MLDPVVARAAAATLLPGFVGTTLPDWVRDRLHAGMGGVCVFGPNIESPAQLRELIDTVLAANPRALVAVDEEGGDVTRLHYATGSPVAGNAVLGRIADPAHTEAVAERIGWELRRVGANLDFAPDADINSNPDNPVIGTRSFGTEPADVADQVVAWTRGLQATGVAACVKHFPGHGDTAQDSHLGLPVIDRTLDELRERELVPFVAAIAAGTRSIMSSHILLPRLDPDRPATLSRRILTGLLREELGFTGLVVSDALDMAGASATIGIPEAAVRAIAAGCDLLCIGSGTTSDEVDDIERAMLTAVEEGWLDADRLRDAAARVAGLAADLERARSGIPMPDPGSDVDAETADLRDDDLCRAIAAFDVRDAARGLLAAHAGRYRLLRLETSTNAAVGTAPWGPAGPGPAEGDPDALLVVVGRSIHRHPEARATVDRLRAAGGPVVVVDMGWPSGDRAYADIATFGASRLVGAALSSYLAGSGA